MELLGPEMLGDVTVLAVLSVILLAVLFLLRLMFKMTARLFRLGCALIFIIVFVVAAGLFLL
ncbi:MAG TPA: hypothetical protein VK879_21465 [Candidatus Sulfomarinibacteraceae bacterium]|nr:hypothetical protein [Candidatus Sulfomarinibacteraceae bacterium]